MRRFSYLKILLVLFIGLVLVIIFSSNGNSTSRPNLNFHKSLSKSFSKSLERPEKKYQTSSGKIVVSFVVCDTRFNESLNVVKSVLIFTKSPVHFVIFTDDILHPKFVEKLNNWKNLTRNQFDFELHRIKFPKDHEQDWMYLFSKCAAQRLFIPKLLPHIDAMIYVDVDTIFLGPAEELWQFFGQFNSTQISAMTLEDDSPNMSWYPRFAKHPFYGKNGLNSGVMLMNLTRMRDFAWVDYVTPIMLEWKLYIPWGDQDIINIIFHYNGGAVHVLPCRYNYRTDQCVYGDACAGAAARGVFLAHGSRRAFHSARHPAFQAIYKAVDEHSLSSDVPGAVIGRLERHLAAAVNTSCGALRDAFLKVPRATLGNYTLPTR
ncbi:glucoside xylosyltransferase 1 [Plutella xylostella]|uniref:glucoside xylosyltransferase 1 n=1 Tax=Plutella xylostella TaxID=51655 RepID=UPI002032DDEC|nr:glucoside xylosyltransferase 1 [Plutella xylostella]